MVTVGVRLPSPHLAEKRGTHACCQGAGDNTAVHDPPWVAHQGAGTRESVRLGPASSYSSKCRAIMPLMVSWRRTSSARESRIDCSI